MRKGIIFFALLLIMFLAACSKDDGITPNERFDAYIDLWQDEDFKAMYDMLATDSTYAYPTEEFIDRYQDINDTDTICSYNIHFSIDMDNIAGEHDFEYKATIIQEGEKE